MLADEGYQKHQSNNKLRDAADKYVDEGHCFSFNSDILFSYDICGPCEAHGILLSMRSDKGYTVDDAPLLKYLPPSLTADHDDLARCPRAP